MNFVYDIILNFSCNNLYYDFYEWKSDDILINVKKIPILKVSSNTLNDFINYEIEVNKDFLNNVCGKSLVSKKEQNKYLYICLLSNSDKTIGVRFSRNGKMIGISSLIIDEEKDCNESILNNKLNNIKYKKNKKVGNKYILRDDFFKKEYLKKEIIEIYKHNSVNKLRYLYYEYFNKECDNSYDMYKELINSLNNYDDRHNYLYKLLKVI